MKEKVHAWSKIGAERNHFMETQEEKTIRQLPSEVRLWFEGFADERKGIMEAVKEKVVPY